MNDQRYGSPKDFRRALTDRLRSNAATGKWTVQESQRQIAYDRLLQRLYRVDPNWILKGAAALVARDLGVRATIDVDLYRSLDSQAAERELRDAAALDLGDWFSFEIGPPRPVADGAIGVRLPVKAFVGTTAWTSFHVDLAGPDVRMTGEPDSVSQVAPIPCR